MTRQKDGLDSHTVWLEDIEYRTEFGSESAKLEIAAALFHARELMGMTQSQLADLAGTSQAYIAKLEKGDANPTIGNIGRLFACMWLKPDVRPVAIEPSKSIESAMIEFRGVSEANIAFPEPDFATYAFQFNQRPDGLGGTRPRAEAQ
jgi:transcriptional regulator with XRE-family HTH domain